MASGCLSPLASLPLASLPSPHSPRLTPLASLPSSHPSFVLVRTCRDYQWCTERLPQETYFTIDGKRDIFWDRPANATAIAEHCEATYAVAPKGHWVAATSEFGRASSASNIVFSNGEYDPWRSGGVLTNLSDTLIAVDIAQGAHHLDLFFSDPADPPSVIAARQVEVAAIRRWVGM